MTDKESEFTDDLLTKHAKALAEHFDTVRIFVTKHDGSKESTLEFTTGF